MASAATSRLSSAPPDKVDEPAKKRKKTDDDDDDDDETMTNDELPPATRSKEYYFADGNCVVRVQNTLFNVHRSMLSRDNSMFTMMFTLPQNGAAPQDGTDDDNPVILSGDTAVDFSYLLWALYALPNEHARETKDTSFAPKLFRIAQIAHKYTFAGVERWACESLSQGMKAGHHYLSDAKRLKLYPEILSFAYEYDHYELLKTLKDYYLKYMKTSVKATIETVDLADEVGLFKLRGQAYFKLLGTPKREWESSFDGVYLTEEHKKTLLSGYYELAQKWDELRESVLDVQHCTTCVQNNQCQRAWSVYWKALVISEKVLDKPLYDVVGRLKLIVNEMKDKRRGVTPGCVTQVVSSLSMISNEVVDSYEVYFLYDSNC